MTLYIGIDPDLHSTAIAALHEGSVEHVTVASIPKPLKGTAAVLAMAREMTEAFREFLHLQHYNWVWAIEGQRIYNRHDKANPNSLILLAQVAGAAVGAALLDEGDRILMPYPQDWKGQVEKDINQARSYREVGWDFKKAKGYCVPTNHGFTNVKDTDWKHLGDAIGIALWAQEQDAKAARAEGALKRARARRSA